MRFLLPALLLFLAGCQSQKNPAAAGGPPPPVPVSVAMAEEESVPNEVHVVGTVEASSVIQVKSQISGTLEKVDFEEGADVKAGDLLFEIDKRPYTEALRQAEAALSRDNANLKQAEANVNRDLAQSKSLEADAQRFATLAKEGIVARNQNEQAQAAAEANRASIQADQAAVEGFKAAQDNDRSAIDRAKLDLTYCEIRSTGAGRAGNLLVHAGNIVTANTTNLVVINKVEPIWVSFGLPEEYLTAVRRIHAQRPMAVEAAPQDNSAPADPLQINHGTLSVIDNTVDTQTGTIKLKATFTNAKRTLWPGQFVNVSLTMDTLAHAVVVPSEAVQPGQQGQMVYVVKQDQTVEPRNVKAGATHGAKVVIEKGIAVGETVVTDGQLRLFPGARIEPTPASKIDSQKL
ncbi:MAG TPA: efflux RND transporter periplasmic adaptor subunit [Bryobacteraceae bacterium]|jgi:multidrug efflux system membrane fusion protein